MTVEIASYNIFNFSADVMRPLCPENKQNMNPLLQKSYILHLFISCFEDNCCKKIANLVLVVRPGDGHTAQLVHNQPIHVRVADASTELLLEEHENVLRHLQAICWKYM